jgi:tyrosyl-DNA phosphodiesterase-1
MCCIQLIAVICGALVLQVRVGTLIPLAKDNAGSSNGSVTTIPIFEGSNVVGRNHLVVADKRISRKHLSLQTSADGSIEVVVVSNSV